MGSILPELSNCSIISSDNVSSNLKLRFREARVTADMMPLLPVNADVWSACCCSCSSLSCPRSSHQGWCLLTGSGKSLHTQTCVACRYEWRHIPPTRCKTSCLSSWNVAPIRGRESNVQVKIWVPPTVHSNAILGRHDHECVNVRTALVCLKWPHGVRDPLKKIQWTLVNLNLRGLQIFVSVIRCKQQYGSVQHVRKNRAGQLSHALLPP